MYINLVKIDVCVCKRVFCVCVCMCVCVCVHINRNIYTYILIHDKYVSTLSKRKSALPSCNYNYDTHNTRSLVVTNCHAHPSDLRSPLISTTFLNRYSHRYPLDTGSSANFYLSILTSR